MTLVECLCVSSTRWFLEVLFPKGVINKDKVGGGDAWGEEGSLPLARTSISKAATGATTGVDTDEAIHEVPAQLC